MLFIDDSHLRQIELLLDYFVLNCGSNASEDTEGGLVSEALVMRLRVLVEHRHDAFHVDLEDLIVLFEPNVLLPELGAGLLYATACSFCEWVDVLIEEELQVFCLCWAVLFSLCFSAFYNIHEKDLDEEHSVQ